MTFWGGLLILANSRRRFLCWETFCRAISNWGINKEDWHTFSWISWRCSGWGSLGRVWSLRFGTGIVDWNQWNGLLIRSHCSAFWSNLNPQMSCAGQWDSNRFSFRRNLRFRFDSGGSSRLLSDLRWSSYFGRTGQLGFNLWRSYGGGWFPTCGFWILRLW